MVRELFQVSAVTTSVIDMNAEDPLTERGEASTLSCVHSAQAKAGCCVHSLLVLHHLRTVRLSCTLGGVYADGEV